MLKKLLLAVALFVTAAVCHAIDVSVYRANIPLDGRHARESSISVSSTAVSVVLSTDATRVAYIAQVQDCAAATDKVFWSIANSNVSTSTGSWMLEGDYFTMDDPVAWQGPMYARVEAGKANCQVTIQELYSTGAPFNQ